MRQGKVRIELNRLVELIDGLVVLAQVVIAQSNGIVDSQRQRIQLVGAPDFPQGLLEPPEGCDLSDAERTMRRRVFGFAARALTYRRSASAQS